MAIARALDDDAFDGRPIEGVSDLQRLLVGEMVGRARWGYGSRAATG